MSKVANFAQLERERQGARMFTISSGPLAAPDVRPKSRASRIFVTAALLER
jgi:hypothetical protein